MWRVLQNNPFKVELIENLTDGEITFCDHDTFTDLCRGGHVPNTGIIKAVKIINLLLWVINRLVKIPNIKDHEF